MDVPWSENVTHCKDNQMGSPALNRALSLRPMILKAYLETSDQIGKFLAKFEKNTRNWNLKSNIYN